MGVSRGKTGPRCWEGKLRQERGRRLRSAGTPKRDEREYVPVQVPVISGAGTGTGAQLTSEALSSVSGSEWASAGGRFAVDETDAKTGVARRDESRVRAAGCEAYEASTGLRIMY